ncbi:hypothetical protein H5185_12515 [Shewanella sp. SG44-6]|uniref:hypothetical protein n=1 Tax=Shewanella sp. SG44-6 TaxID=2760959 RepID=UPI0016045534|nr:hypothetical protein [Shewanella sp. SG44-6]MBB1390235.1 hypothetical protein [Shewanella sp. SG44-6]
MGTKPLQENKELEVTRISLINELDGIKTYINAYRNEYDDCQRQIQHVREVLESTQQQTKMAKARYVEMVAAAKSAFNSTVHQLEQDALTEYAIQNIVTLDRLREETIDQINNEHRYRRDEIGAFEVALQAKKIELSHIELVIENNLAKEVYLGELENHLESQLNNFKQKELEWKKAALANSSIKRHFSRLEPDLRDMCRKGGIPWPFNSSLLSELSPSEGSKQ